jgi:hypothetical protein
MRRAISFRLTARKSILGFVEGERPTGSEDRRHRTAMPRSGYGFGGGGPPNPSLEEHRQRIREFLAMVDPTTGYIEAD